MKSVAFATVVGGHVDYEFLLGSIVHHAKFGPQVVLDVTPEVERRHFRGLPDSVIWVYDDSYKSNTSSFVFRPALMKALRIARSLRTDVLMHLDSDEFVTSEAHSIFGECMKRQAMVENLIVTWGSDKKPRIPTNCWSRRIWPSCMDVDMPPNMASVENIENHPIPLIPYGTKAYRTDLSFHHHVHWVFPQKGTAIFDHFPVGGDGPWPEPLRKWRDEGVAPSASFR